MSHELRTPLNSILGFTATVLNEMAGPVNAEQARQLGFVHDSAKHLLSVIIDLLDLSQIEAGRMELFPEPLDLPEVVERVVLTLEARARAKGLTIRTDHCDRPCPLVSDRRRVAQVLLNLADNAVKFSSAGEILVRCCCDEKTARVEVVDQGIGIAEEDLDRLFEPFRQLDAVASRRHEGTGLGLSICGRLVDLLGGEIGVHSEPGVGSTFFFTLPRPARTAGSA
jgi:signal transduction histidine kinase